MSKHALAVTQGELISVRELVRDPGLAHQLERITTGEVEKLVVRNGNDFRAVVVSPEHYARLSARAALAGAGA